MDGVLFDSQVGDDGLEPYRVSISNAVASWKFTPFIIIRKVANGNGKAVRERVPMPFSLWYKFQFIIRDGQPVTTVDGQTSP